MNVPTEPAPKTNKALIALVAGNLLVTTAFGVFIITHPADQDLGEHGEAKHDKDEKAGDNAEGDKEGGKGEKKPAAEHEGAAKAEGKAPEGESPEGAKAEGAGAEGAEGAGGAKKAEVAGGNTARLEDIIVRLRNPEIDRYARLTLDVEMANPSQLAQLQARSPQIRDAVITALSEKTFEDLRGADGLGRMKALLRERIDEVVPGDVSAVYVSGFIVQ